MENRKPSNQELRTRKDLLSAANRLLKKGIKPGMEEVAEEAMVSRATAYRYFGNVDSLLAEVPIDTIVQDPGDLFADDSSDDPEERVDRAEAYLHGVVYENEARLRIILANSIAHHAEGDAAPARQNRRMPLIEAALAPARHRFRDDLYDKLCAALAMIFGPESMVVFRDVIGIDEETARQVKSWTVRALVKEALASQGTERKKPGVRGRRKKP